MNIEHRFLPAMPPAGKPAGRVVNPDCCCTIILILISPQPGAWARYAQQPAITAKKA